MPGLRIPLAFLAAWGCRRTPGLALVALAFFVPHQLLSYRVWRFVQPGLPLLLLLAACGLHDLLERARPQFARGLVALWLAAEVGSAGVAWHSESLWETTWLHNQGGTAAIAKSRALHRAYRFLSGHDEARNFVNQVLPKGGAPGRASLGQRVQIAHPVGMGPPPPMSRHIIDAAQTQAARRAGFVELWRDPQGLVTIVQRPRVTPADPSTQGR